MLRMLLSVGVLLVTGMSCGYAQTPAMRHTPIDVSADKLEVDQERQEATFSGNVRVEQGGLRLTADSLTVFYAAGSAEKDVTQSVKRIVADGQAVTVVYGKDTATGKQAVYDMVGGEVTLSGGVVLVRGGNTLKGDRLVFNLSTGKVSLLSTGNQRVRAQFTPKASSK